MTAAARDHKRDHALSLHSFPYRKGTHLVLKVLLVEARDVKANKAKRKTIVFYTNVRLMYSKVIVLCSSAEGEV